MATSQSGGGLVFLQLTLYNQRVYSTPQRSMSTLVDNANEHSFQIQIHSWYLSKSLTHEAMQAFMRLHYAPLLAIYSEPEHFHGLAASFRAYIMHDDVYWTQRNNAAQETALSADFCVCAKIASTEYNFPRFIHRLNKRAPNEHHTAQVLRDVHAAFLQVTRRRAAHDMAERCVSSCPPDIFDAMQSVSSPDISRAAHLVVLEEIQAAVLEVSVQGVNMRARRRHYKRQQDERYTTTIAAPRPQAPHQDDEHEPLCFGDV